MKKYFFLIILLLCSCSTVNDQIAGDVYKGGEKIIAKEIYQYKIGEYSINIVDWDEVNEQYQKVCTTYCGRTVKGFVNLTTKEMWSTPNVSTILHEFKHIMDGQFHPKH